MRIYLNTSALNRPFDDLSARRVRMEAEAVVGLIEAVEQGKVKLVSSEYLEFEVGQDLDQERVAKVTAFLALADRTVAATGPVIERARTLEGLGLRGLDALHLASAEAAEVELLVTTDDRFLRRSNRRPAGRGTRVLSPLDALAMIDLEDQP